MGRSVDAERAGSDGHAHRLDRQAVPGAELRRARRGPGRAACRLVGQDFAVGAVGGILLALGVVLLVFTFLLAFTTYGLVAAMLGLVCIALGAVVLGRRSG